EDPYCTRYSILYLHDALPISSFGQRNEPYIISAFVSGDGARELLADGENAALASGLEVLKRELNRPDLHPTAAHLVNWPADPFRSEEHTSELQSREKLVCRLL